MKKMIIVLMLLGVMTLEASPKYRIQTWSHEGVTFYMPQKKVWYETNYFPLPFKIWVSSDYPFQNKWQAEEIINNWKIDYNEKHNRRKLNYIEIK
jgi:hypothetical protein